MAVIEDASTGTTQAVGATTASPAHATLKPVPYETLGHYRFAGVTGAIAAGAAANSEVLQLRWTDSSRFCLVHQIRITGLRATTAFAAGTIDIKATIARSFTASGTGGTAVTLTGDNQQMRTSMGASLVGDLRIATTAALGAGTKTLDTQDVGIIVTHSSAGPFAATPIIGQQYLPTDVLYQCDFGRGEHPIMLAQNEGVVVRATVPGTGVWNIGVEIVWSEVTAF